MKRQLQTAALAVLLSVYAGGVWAIGNVNFNGFLTAGGTKSDADVTSENGNISDDVSFEQDTRVGVQISAEVNDKLSLTAQRDHIPNPSTIASFEMAHLAG